MKRTVAQRILRRIRAKRQEWVFTPKDFVDLGSRDAVDQALHRLSEQKLIQRLDRGLYFYSAHSQYHSTTSDHHIDAIARALAAQTGHRAMLTGEEAARRLRLMPNDREYSHYEYLTTGRSKERTVGEITIRFKHTSISPPEAVSEHAIQVMQALSYLKKERITPAVLNTCAEYLQSSEREQLRKLASQAPAWLIPILHYLSTATDSPSMDATPSSKNKSMEPA